MRILAVSDMESRFIWEHFDPEAFRGVELILSCGDLKAEYLSYLVTMIPAPLFYVPGNHDESFLRRPPDGCECLDGRVLEYKGLRVAGLGGCLGTNPNGCFEYSEAQMARRVKKLVGSLGRGKPLDIFVSHAPALGIGDAADRFHLGFACFLELHRQTTPRYHLFGHTHLSGSPVNPNAVYRSGDVTLLNCTGYRLIDI